MKKVNLLLAAVVAASVAAPSFAATPIDTYGYFRVNASQAKGGKMTKWNVSKVGRLGNENDNYGEFGARVQFAKVDDTTWTFQGTWSLLSESEQGLTPEELYNKEAFVSVKGLFDFDKEAELWAGRRFLRQYNGITDWYYSDNSGNGAGINNLQVGPGKASVYWSRTTKKNEYTYNEDVYVKNYTDKKIDTKAKGSKFEGHKYVDYFNVDYTFGLWDGAELLVKDTYGVVTRQSGAVKSKDDLGNNNRFNLELHVGGSNFWNNTSFEWFHGSNAGVETSGGWADAYAGAKSANVYRIHNMGHYIFNSYFGVEHLISYAYGTGYDKEYKSGSVYDAGKDYVEYSVDKEKLFKAVVRPTVKLTKMTKLVAELGAYKQIVDTFEGDKITENGQKYTLAYCITPDTGNLLWGPAIKFFVTYIHADKHSDDYGRQVVGGITSYDNAYQDVNHNTMFGVQAEGWW